MRLGAETSQARTAHMVNESPDFASLHPGYLKDL